VAASHGAHAPGTSTSEKRPGLNIGDLGTAVTIVGGVAGLVYIVGGAVLGGRLRFYSLPTEAVVVQIPQWALLAVGLEEVVLPTVGIVSAFALWRLVLISVLIPLCKHIPLWKRREEALAAVQGAVNTSHKNPLSRHRTGLFLEPLIVAWVIYLLFALLRDSNFTGGEGLAQISHGLDYLWLLHYPWLLVATTVIAIFAIPAAFHYVKSFSDPMDIRNMTGIVAVLTLVLWTLMASTLPLLDVKVCRRSVAGEVEVTGWLVATSSDRLYIGQSNVRASRYVQALPLSDATEVFISGDARNAICTP
jgi:hypothetical protein